MTEPCRGVHTHADLPSEGARVWLLLCTGCPLATLVIGSRPYDEYPTRQLAEQAYKALIAQGDPVLL